MVAICHNDERFLAQSLDSVRAQTYPAVELVILDDCSTDGSVARIRDWMASTGSNPTFLVHDANQGICRSRNHALEHVHGDFVSFISTDDWWLPGKLARQVEVLRNRPDAAVVYGDARQVDEAGAPLPRTVLEAADRGFAAPPEGRILDLLLVGHFIPPGPMVRRRCLEEVGSYDESLAYEDWDMWLRFADRYEFAFSLAVDVVKRDVATSLWKSLASTHKSSDLRILLKHVDRHPWLWHRVAVLAYETDHPDQRAFFRARLRHGFSWRVLRFYVQSVVGFRRDRAQRLKQALSRRAPAWSVATEGRGTQSDS